MSSRWPIPWSQVTAVFGGTFDPPHLGHREAAFGLLREPGVGRVLVMPSASPPHKPMLASAEDRMRMSQLNFGPDSRMQVSALEIERARQSSGPSYSFDTLQELKQSHPELAFVIGTDQLQALSSWHRFPEILSLSHWLVLARKPDGAKPALQTLAEWEASGLARRAAGNGPQGQPAWQLKGGTHLLLVETRAPALSSSQIRENLAKSGLPPENSLALEVWAHLKQTGLYGTRKA